MNPADLIQELIDRLCEISAEFGIEAINGTENSAREVHTEGVQTKRLLLDALASKDTALAEIRVELDKRPSWEIVDTTYAKWKGRAESAEAELARARKATIEECAKAYEAHDKTSRDWIPGSLWDTLNREAAARVRSLGPLLDEEVGG